jgi:hypothetical protein
MKPLHLFSGAQSFSIKGVMLHIHRHILRYIWNNNITTPRESERERERERVVCGACVCVFCYPLNGSPNTCSQ